VVLYLLIDISMLYLIWNNTIFSMISFHFIVRFVKIELHFEAH